MFATTMMAVALALQAAPDPRASHAAAPEPQTATIGADEKAVRAVLADRLGDALDDDRRPNQLG